jgi:hypothetical protein
VPDNKYVFIRTGDNRIALVVKQTQKIFSS